MSGVALDTTSLLLYYPIPEMPVGGSTGLVNDLAHIQLESPSTRQRQNRKVGIKHLVPAPNEPKPRIATKPGLCDGRLKRRCPPFRTDWRFVLEWSCFTWLIPWAYVRSRQCGCQSRRCHPLASRSRQYGCRSRRYCYREIP